MGVNILLNGANLLELTNEVGINDIRNAIHAKTFLTSSEYYLLQNGKLINQHEDESKPNFNGFSNIHIVLTVNGGKGGFGSMLRAIGAQIEKTTNREACRDLSGRRLRDINEEKRLKAFLEKQKDIEEDPKDKIKRKIAKLMAQPKNEFKDEKYELARAGLTENVTNALEQGLKNVASGSGLCNKRKATDNNAISAKKRKMDLWLGIDDLSSSSDTDSESDSN